MVGTGASYLFLGPTRFSLCVRFFFFFFFFFFFVFFVFFFFLPQIFSDVVGLSGISNCRAAYCIHYENFPMQYTEIFSRRQKMKISLEFFYLFNIFAQNIHCGYTLEPPHRGGSNEYPQCMIWIKNKKISKP